MKRYSFVITLLTGLLIMLSARTPAHSLLPKEQPVTNLPGEYLSTWLTHFQNPANSLIILDIDDTVLTTPQGQWLGSSTMFYHLLDEATAKHPEWSSLQAAEHIDTLLAAIYLRVPFSLTDSTLPQAIELAIRQGARVLGMTSRGAGVKAETLWQLKQAGIVFSDTGEDKILSLGDNRISYLEQGVAFVSHGNSKGEILNHLLIHEKTLFSNIHQILFIDDRQKHLDDITASAQSLGIPASTVLCTWPDNRGTYQPDIARKQLHTFLHNWSEDVAIHKLLTTNPYAQSLAGPVGH